MRDVIAAAEGIEDFPDKSLVLAGEAPGNTGGLLRRGFLLLRARRFGGSRRLLFFLLLANLIVFPDSLNSCQRACHEVGAKELSRLLHFQGNERAEVSTMRVDVRHERPLCLLYRPYETAHHVGRRA